MSSDFMIKVKGNNIKRKYRRWILTIFFGMCLILGPLGQANGGLLEKPAYPQNGGVIVPPGNPIEIAVAMFNGWPNSTDINLAVQMAMDDYGSRRSELPHRVLRKLPFGL